MCVPEKRALSKERERFRKNIDPPPVDAFLRIKKLHTKRKKREERERKSEARTRENSTRTRGVSPKGPTPRTCTVTTPLCDTMLLLLLHYCLLSKNSHNVYLHAARACARRENNFSRTRGEPGAFHSAVSFFFFFSSLSVSSSSNSHVLPHTASTLAFQLATIATNPNVGWFALAASQSSIAFPLSTSRSNRLHPSSNLK